MADHFAYKRPDVGEFLELCREHFEVAVWTSSTADYASAAVETLFGTVLPLLEADGDAGKRAVAPLFELVYRHRQFAREGID